MSLASEKKQRKLAQEQLGDNLVTKTAPFSFKLPGGGEELRGAVHVYIPNLVEKITKLLEQNEQ